MSSPFKRLDETHSECADTGVLKIVGCQNDISVWRTLDTGAVAILIRHGPNVASINLSDDEARHLVERLNAALAERAPVPEAVAS